MKRVKNNGGYTLIEILFVLTTIILIGGAIIPFIEAAYKTWSYSDVFSERLNETRAALDRISLAISSSDTVVDISIATDPMGFIELNTAAPKYFSTVPDTTGTGNLLLERGSLLLKNVKSFNITAYEPDGVTQTLDTSYMNSFKLDLVINIPDQTNPVLKLSTRIKKRTTVLPNPWRFTILGDNNVRLEDNGIVRGNVHSNGVLFVGAGVTVTGKSTDGSSWFPVPIPTIDMPSYMADAKQVINGNLLISKKYNNKYVYVRGNVWILAFFRRVDMKKTTIIAEGDISITGFQRIRMDPNKKNLPVLATKTGNITGFFNTQSAEKGLIFSEQGDIDIRGPKLRGNLIARRVRVRGGWGGWNVDDGKIYNNPPRFFKY